MSKSKKTGGFKLQPRDEIILRGLLDSRIMTIKHAAALHFKGRFEAAKKRLQKLEAAGFIAKRPRRVQEPAVYSLTRMGYLSLKEEGMLDPLLELGWAQMRDRIQVSEFLLQHELAVRDVKAALVPAVEKAEGLTLKEFTVTAERHAFRVAQAIVDAARLVGFRSLLAKPDGFFHVAARTDRDHAKNHYFFIEVDRSTESLRRLVNKAGQYSQFYRKGGFAAKLGFPRDDFKRHPFRALIVVMTAERRNNIADKLLRMTTPVRNIIWLTTMQELLADPLGAIWVRPSDHLEAIRDTVYDMTTEPQSAIYRRHAERDAWVEAKVRKQRLFGE